MPKWGKTVLIAAGSLVFGYLLIALGMQSHAVARLIGNPTTCGTCHYMAPQVASYETSGHKEVGCLACHSSPDFLTRPVDEVAVSSRHIRVTLSKSEPLAPALSPEERSQVLTNCYVCHQELVQNLHKDKQGDCLACHRAEPHGRPTHAGT